MRATLSNADLALQSAEQISPLLAECLTGQPVAQVIDALPESSSNNYLWLEEQTISEVVGIEILSTGWISSGREKLETLTQCLKTHPNKWSWAEQPEQSKNWRSFTLMFAGQHQLRQKGILIDPKLERHSRLVAQLNLWKECQIKLSCCLLLKMNAENGFDVVGFRTQGYPDGSSINSEIQDIIYGNLVIGGNMQIDFESTFALSLELGQIELPLKDALQLRAGSQLAVECQFPLQARLKISDQKWADVELVIEEGGLRVKVL